MELNSSDEALQEKRERLAYTIHLGGSCIYIQVGVELVEEGSAWG